MITLKTKAPIEGKMATLDEVIETNELEFCEVAHALSRYGVYRIDAGSNGISDFCRRDYCVRG